MILPLSMPISFIVNSITSRWIERPLTDLLNNCEVGEPCAIWVAARVTLAATWPAVDWT